MFFYTLIWDVKLLRLIYKKLKDIKQYENNPRKNNDAVKYIAESKPEEKEIMIRIIMNILFNKM